MFNCRAIQLCQVLVDKIDKFRPRHLFKLLIHSLLMDIKNVVLTTTVV